MTQAEFEKELSCRQTKRRWLLGGLTLLFFAMFILFWILLEATKEVTVHGGTYFPAWESVRYNHTFIYLLIFGLCGVFFCGISLIMDFLICGYKTIQKDQQYITVYRGMLHNFVYVDGKEKGRIGPFSVSHVVEVWLQSKVKVTVSFSRTIWLIAHISFSDHTPSMEV